MNTEIFKKTYEMLNPEQRDAVETLDGAVMVIAGPGTGKTQIIGMRTANIILKAGVDPSNILITTFTEAGVIAIRERLIEMIGSDAYRVNVSTIHSFSQDVIKTFPEKFTVEKLDTPIDDIESMEILSQIVSEKLRKGELEYLTSYGDTLFYVRHIKTAINNLKREGVGIKKFETSIAEETEKSLAWLEEKRNNKRIKRIEKYEDEHETKIGKLTELQSIFEIYNKTLRERHLYDFNDMINFVLERFREDKNLRAHYAETYQYIMLDEYQDTNNPQNEIVDLILSYGDTTNIMVVGDDDQSIYRFQGANIENMLDFTSTYPDAKIIVLDKNYRSQQAILDASKNLIENNSERLISRIPGLDKQLFAQRGFELQTPHLYMALSDIDERLYIKDQIQILINNKVKMQEIAVIVRSNKEVEIFSEFLKSYDIAVSSKIDSNILDSDYISEIITFFKLLENPYSDEIGFINLLRSSLIEIDNMDILKINNFLYRENYVRRGNKLKIFDILRDEQALEQIGIEDTTHISKFVEDYLDAQMQFAQHNFIFAFSYFLKTFGIFEHVQSGGSFEDMQDVYTLFHSIKSWSLYTKELSLGNIISKIDLYEKYGYRINRQSQGETSLGVQIVTAHGSKGLEYEYVFIPGLYSGNWDGKSMRQLIKLPEGIAGDGLQFALGEDMSDAERKKYEKDRQEQEDRRLFFVALTRAKYLLYLSFPASILGKAKIISPFIGELGKLVSIESLAKREDISTDMKNEILQESRLISYNSEEIEYIGEFMKSYKLSASDLNCFLVDPKEFLYRSVYRYPFQDNENSIFGTMYHRTLELFYKKILDSGEVPEYSYMEYVYLKQLEREYLSSEEKTRLKKRGVESLKGYYENYSGTFTAPLKTEYRFSRRNIFFDGIPITGIIDKIELLSDDFSENTSGGSLFSQNIKITDYKTGSVKYTGEIKGIDKAGNKDDGYERGRYGRQLMFYKLLFDNDFELSSQYNLSSLELDFCEGKKGNYKRVEVDF
ncbi:ATP-dependent helicase, partial [Candidatus Gracilibacteria bacterium]|nr:ATP-dependent helicase [Candidatus Gracilibacteria bacterium]